MCGHFMCVCKLETKSRKFIYELKYFIVRKHARLIKKVFFFSYTFLFQLSILYVGMLLECLWCVEQSVPRRRFFFYN